MPHDVECTHCRVLMTSLSPREGEARSWACPFCGRTQASVYAEVITPGAGPRRAAAAQAAQAAPSSMRAASPPPLLADDERWREIASRAARWFARLEREQQVLPRKPQAAAPAAAAPARAAAPRLRAVPPAPAPRPLAHAAAPRRSSVERGSA